MCFNEHVWHHFNLSVVLIMYDKKNGNEDILKGNYSGLYPDGNQAERGKSIFVIKQRVS